MSSTRAHGSDPLPHRPGTAQDPSPQPQGWGPAALTAGKCPHSSTRHTAACGRRVSRTWAGPCRAATHWTVASSAAGKGLAASTSPGAATVQRMNFGSPSPWPGVVDEQPPRCKMGHSRDQPLGQAPGSGVVAPSGAAGSVTDSAPGAAQHFPTFSQVSMPFNQRVVRDYLD
jgi:hypothetical protein